MQPFLPFTVAVTGSGKVKADVAASTRQWKFWATAKSLQKIFTPNPALQDMWGSQNHQTNPNVWRKALIKDMRGFLKRGVSRELRGIKGS